MSYAEHKERFGPISKRQWLLGVFALVLLIFGAGAVNLIFKDDSGRPSYVPASARLIMHGVWVDGPYVYGACDLLVNEQYANSILRSHGIEPVAGYSDYGMVCQ